LLLYILPSCGHNEVMEKRFEARLDQFNEMAKDQLRDDLSPEEEQKLSVAWDYNIETASRRAQTSAETQQAIYNYQLVKQKLMQQMKERITELDNPDAKPEWAEDAYLVTEQEGKLLCLDDEGEPRNITVGDILTDGEWGIHYNLDEKSVPRNIRKSYIIETAKQQLRHYLDQQIYLNEAGSANTYEMTREAYEASMESSQADDERRGGIIVERMVRIFLKKMAINHDTDYEIEESNLFLDINRKIDFIIQRRSHFRGVTVEQSDDHNLDHLGVQFTINQSPEKLDLKRRQLDRMREKMAREHFVEDIALVQLAPRVSGEVLDVYSQWYENKSPGGPDKMWGNETKEKIFRGLLDGMFTPEEIASQWGKVDSDQLNPTS
jgi:hypothetical protein